ncbi:MAG: hypothetical protein LBJ90_06100, partial [Treponema sp.]|nr:hypothetical protein [Treponema sp.]
MTDKWLTANEVAQLMSIDPRSANRRAQLDKWPYRSFAVRGGKERRYHLAALPEKIQAAYSASIGITLDDLKAGLFPALKSEPPDPAVKPLEKRTAAERDTARLREKVILEWRQSGLTQAD